MIPSAVAHSVSLSCYHPHPSDHQHAIDSEYFITSELTKCLSHYHAVSIKSLFYFPERRLIQYDCGM